MTVKAQSKVRRRLAAALGMCLAAALAVAPDSAPASAAGTGPCDIYAAGGTPCVAAHSTVRALYGSYGGNLYQVRRSSDNTTRDIAVVAAGGTANAATQDTFCAGTSCVITVVYDQSGRGNDLWYQGSSVVPGSSQSRPATATSESLTVGGGKAYSLYINPGNSYWRDGHLTGVPTGSAPEGMYMVTSGTHVNGGCCFDYGNSETTRSADAAGAMDAINFSTQCWFGGCSGTGPWVQADLEWGLFSGGSQSWNPNQRAFPNRFVTAMLKNNGTSRFAIKGANAQSGGVTTLWDGSLPPGYSPMRKQGAIILGSGGDCCKPGGGANLSAGTFYEGAMVSGYPSDATENAVQANIIAAGYSSGGSGATGAVRSVAAGRCLDVNAGSTAAGTPLQIWDCNGGTNQTWTRTASGQLTVYSGDSTRCAAASGSQTGAAVVIAACDGGAGQRWQFNANGTVSSAQSGLCLDVNGAATANGTKTILWTCHGGGNQQWTTG
ncbi:arabinofuranosidase catalytic domain-containing protein [Lentzea sp. BCCO 10_0061]|uniref:Arabinofuranosidase catalytic domain-containing protein n=1 Tax=Lentzea sokolovensis TaxID=3095429 RepID=A0ABU4UT27_9PSEU|nr:arabinofuranosidase catalytic domain-containing protein [Lentzea sp. BCCO 10_0061]MDX8142395.1 arabinofuranosidase catalytic domain-containing protein [Lentzea sp. BCCO 10_0061]